MARLLVATTNPDKLREILAILGHLPVEIRTLRDMAPVPEPEETGGTLGENARLKALYYDTIAEADLAPALVRPRYTVAEDSGLVIDALDGEPGVRSASTIPKLCKPAHAAVCANQASSETNQYRRTSIRPCSPSTL